MPPPGGGQQADNSLAALWITIGVFILCAFIWYFFKTTIIEVVLLIRHYEAEFVQLFVPTLWTQPLQTAQEFIKQAQQTQFQGVTFYDLIDISTAVGNYLRYPAMIILSSLAFLIYTTNITSRFNKKYTMQRLLEDEKYNWPQMLPVAKLDLVHEDINKGPWAMAMTPMDFAKKHNLLIVEKMLPKDVQLESKAILIASVNKDEARKVFAMQLGRYWVSPEALPSYMRALFAVFSARVEGDGEGATQLLNHISLSSEHGPLDFSGTDALLKKYGHNKQIIKLTKRHAFELTVMASMLEFARADGVISTADFLWLKPVSRRLWYMLNCVGRQTPFSEISGPFAHWLAENEIGRKLNVPMVEEAVTGLELAIKDFIYRPETED